jgi:malic enzyme
VVPVANWQFPMSNPTALCEVDPGKSQSRVDSIAFKADRPQRTPWHGQTVEHLLQLDRHSSRSISPTVNNVRLSPCHSFQRTNCPDEVAQTNNALIYPALGLGAILARSRTISPSMLMAGVHALASLSPALHNPEASLLPDLADVRKVSVEVAAAVVRQAVEDGNATDEETIKVVNGKASLGLEDYIRVSF